MYSKAKIGGHPIHPMLIPFPIAFYTATVVSLIVYAASANPFWFHVAVVANGAGIVMAALAAIPGLIDYVKGVPRGTSAATTARNHALLNSGALLLFVINFFYIREGWAGAIPDTRVAIVLSALGLLSTIGAGWFGWNLTQKHHVGVDPVPVDALEGTVPTTHTTRPVVR